MKNLPLTTGLVAVVLLGFVGFEQHRSRREIASLRGMLRNEQRKQSESNPVPAPEAPGVQASASEKPLSAAQQQAYVAADELIESRIVNHVWSREDAKTLRKLVSQIGSQKETDEFTVTLIQALNRGQIQPEDLRDFIP